MIGSVLEKKCLDFSIKIAQLAKDLHGSRESIIAKQLLRSATSIGANVAEATHAQSKPDWYAKLKIADKEAAESAYWLKILRGADYISKERFFELHSDIIQIIRIIGASCKTYLVNEKEKQGKAKQQNKI